MMRGWWGSGMYCRPASLAQRGALPRRDPPMQGVHGAQDPSSCLADPSKVTLCCVKAEDRIICPAQAGSTPTTPSCRLRQVSGRMLAIRAPPYLSGLCWPARLAHPTCMQWEWCWGLQFEPWHTAGVGMAGWPAQGQIIGRHEGPEHSGHTLQSQGFNLQRPLKEPAAQGDCKLGTAARSIGLGACISLCQCLMRSRQVWCQPGARPWWQGLLISQGLPWLAPSCLARRLIHAFTLSPIPSCRLL